MKLLMAALAGSLLYGAAISSAQATPAQRCVFETHAPVAVSRYVPENNFGYGAYSFYVGGAQLFVPGREGLTKEWLAASVQQALALPQGASGPSCSRPPVKDVHVSVVPFAHGFWVLLISHSSQGSEALLKWARSIVVQPSPL